MRKENRILNDALTSVLFLDRYKNLYDVVTTGYYDYYSLSSFQYYNNIKTLFDIRNFYLTDEEELINALDSSKFFYDGHILFKSVLMNQLSSTEDEYLSGVTKYHDLDVKKFKRIITKEELYDYVSREKSILSELDIDANYDEIFILNMTNYIQKMFLCDPNSVQILINDIIESIYNNYNKLSKSEKENFKDIIELKDKIKENFNIACIYSKEILNSLMSLFVIMMDEGFIKQKKLIKE